jgi:hypothetical protein
MATVKADQASLVARYAGTFHDVIGGGHHVASPLGAWLLLALCAPAARGAQAAGLAEVLGGGADEVTAVAAEMLAAPHPLVAAAAAVWNRPGSGDERWLAGLPASVARGDIPPQDGLNRWARDHTFGLIDKFPLTVDATVYLLLATALATKVSWDRPFDLAPGTALGPSSPWAKDLRQVLKSPKHPSHSAFITATPRAGDVAVHVGQARGGLLVVSVIAAADVSRADVLAAAHAIAIAFARGEPLPRRSLSGLPAGDAPLWSVRDERSRVEFGERCVAVLPAWSATDDYNLSDPRLGFAAAARALGHGDPWRARQAVTASYSRTGFEAAAVTAMAIAMAMRPRGGVLRTVELRFGHPYAVVAVTTDDDSAHTAGKAESARSGEPGPWHGVPVFSAWVAEPHSAKNGNSG